jgi:hypothetical protein
MHCVFSCICEGGEKKDAMHTSWMVLGFRAKKVVDGRTVHICRMGRYTYICFPRLLTVGMWAEEGRGKSNMIRLPVDFREEGRVDVIRAVHSDFGESTDMG